MTPALSALVALQALDSAADALRKRLADMPAAEQAIAAAADTARAGVEAAKARIQENTTARRALEKDVAVVDGRLSKFEDHKAAVKTNQEYTALLHEIATAKSEKDAIEERLLLLMEDGDGHTAALKTAERALQEETERGKQARSALDADRAQINGELERLAHERTQEARAVDATLMAKYSQLLKQRKGVAVARMVGEICEACHVRLRPHVTQQVRRNDGIVQCDSCQRVLYFVAPVEKSPGVRLGSDT